MLRIPSDDFVDAVASLAELGEEAERRIDTEDVTEELVDLRTRLATAQASVDRTRELMEQAESILSTVTLHLIKEHAAPIEEAEPREAGFLVGLRAGWDAFVATMTVLVTVAGALLPWLVTAAVPVAGVLWWRRRRISVRA